MLRKLRVILEMIKFSHTIFALPFALLAACLASVREGGWRLIDVAGVLACMVFARSAAMAFNRWADRKLDADNPRTKTRAIPAGELSAGYVLVFVVANSICFISGTALFWLRTDNPTTWPLILSLPVLAFLFGYSYAKRFTFLAHAWLGAALAVSPSAAWLAVRGQLELSPLLLSAAVVFWVTGFDVIYACQDIDADRKQGLYSIPARLGFDGAMTVARLCHLLMVVDLVVFGWMTPELHVFYWVGVAGVAVLLFLEHWLVRGRDLLRVNVAFLQVNGVISVGLLLVTVADLYLI